MSDDEPKAEKPDSNGQPDKASKPKQPEAGGNSGSVQKGPSKHGEQHDDYEDDPYSSPLEWVSNKLGKPQTLNALMVIFTGLLVTTSTCQWRTMNRALKTEQRAWVGVDRVDGEEIEPGKPIKITVRVINTGQSPAKDVRIIRAVHRGNPDKKASRIMEDGLIQIQLEEQSKVVLMPRSAFLAKTTTDFIVTPEKFDEIESGAALVRVVGQITYRDIFDQSHDPLFCFHYNPETKDYDGCPDHNEMN